MAVGAASAIKMFFGCTIQEVKALSKKERHDLAREIEKATGWSVTYTD